MSAMPGVIYQQEWSLVINLSQGAWTTELTYVSSYALILKESYPKQ